MPDIQVSVSIVEGRPATTSLAIAECFGKRHCDVMRDIQKLIEDCPEDFRQRNFALTFREVPGPNGAVRKEPYYTVFFDGFMLLVMGYTGKKALTMKLAYIGAFNAMREKLEAKTAPALPDWFRPEDGERLAGTIKREPFGKIRMLVRDNALWFAGVDICRYSGRSWSGTLRTTLLPKDCKLLIKTHFGFSPNGKGLLMVREDFVKWLFDLKCQNRSLKFEEWFFGEALPALRAYFGTQARAAISLKKPQALPSRKGHRQAALPELPEVHGRKPPLKPRTLEELLKDASSVETSLARLVLHISLEFGMPIFLAKQNCKGENLEDMARAIDFNLQGAHAAACTALNQLRSAKYLCYAVKN